MSASAAGVRPRASSSTSSRDPSSRQHYQLFQSEWHPDQCQCRECARDQHRVEDEVLTQFEEEMDRLEDEVRSTQQFSSRSKRYIEPEEEIEEEEEGMRGGDGEEKQKLRARRWREFEEFLGCEELEEEGEGVGGGEAPSITWTRPPPPALTGASNSFNSVPDEEYDPRPRRLHSLNGNIPLSDDLCDDHPAGDNYPYYIEDYDLGTDDRRAARQGAARENEAGGQGGRGTSQGFLCHNEAIYQTAKANRRNDDDDDDSNNNNNNLNGNGRRNKKQSFTLRIKTSIKKR